MMDFPRPCGCKGCRTCLSCEKEYGIEEKPFINQYKSLEPFVFCPNCNKIYPGNDVNIILKEHPNHQGNGLSFPGVYVEPDFITDEESKTLLNGIDSLPWDISQSGRRKQNYGPKTNFKKRKLTVGTFKGFPLFSKFVQERLCKRSILSNFQTIEQCSLEYDPSKGASIDPHIDDCWVWGERVVTVNCLADSILTLVPYSGDQTKYNLHLVDSYRETLKAPYISNDELDIFRKILVKVPMPNRSLIVMYGPARYQFEHSVLRDDITTRRVCIAYREFTPFYLNGGNETDKGKSVLDMATSFWQ